MNRSFQWIISTSNISSFFDNVHDVRDLKFNQQLSNIKLRKTFPLSKNNIRIHVNPHLSKDGFRGGELMTCHPLFSNITLQSQILVTERFFLTSVSKFIRKYLLPRQFSRVYSSCCKPVTSSIRFSGNFSQE